MATTKKTDDEAEAGSDEKAPAAEKKAAWNPSGLPEERACPECGLVPSNDFPTYDPTKPAAYQALVFHYRGRAAMEPTPEFPRGLPAINGQHPDAALPADPDVRA